MYFVFQHEIQLRHALHACVIECYQKSQNTEMFLFGHLKLNLGYMQKEVATHLSGN